jgi:hypothetical protein
MAAAHQDLVWALAHDHGHLSTSLADLAAKSLITIAWTPGGETEAVDRRGLKPLLYVSA